jgi:hypothetical protein
MIRLTVQGIKQDLANGLTRLTADKHYNAEVGSIEEKYNLPPTEVRRLFMEPALKGLKVIPAKPKLWELVDETEVSDTVESITQCDTAMEFGIPTHNVEESIEEKPQMYGTTDPSQDYISEEIESTMETESF